jgi:SH3-like domain-containing protein
MSIRSLGLAAILFVVGALPAIADQVIPADRVVQSVNVREGPSTTTARIGLLRKGDRATLLLSVPNWYRIRLADGTEGFVSKAWAQFTT